MKIFLAFVMAFVSIILRFYSFNSVYAQGIEKTPERIKAAAEIKARKLSRIEERTYGASNEGFDEKHQESKVTEYNHNGFVTGETISNSASGALAVAWKRECKFDELDNVVLDEEFQPDSKSLALAPSQRWEYVYDAGGRKVSEICKDTINSETLETGVYKYEGAAGSLYEKSVRGIVEEKIKRKYNAAGKEALHERFDSKGDLVEKITTSYHDNGSISESLVFHDGDKPDRRVTYDNRGNMTGIYIYIAGELVEKTVMIYDAPGNLISDACFRKEHRVYNTDYKYDDSNNMTEKTYFYNSILEYRVECEYDQAGNRVAEKVYRPASPGSPCALAETIKMTYDASKNITSMSVYNGAGKPLKKTVFEYTFEK